ncbi:hypothetical protein G7046_g4894 [Stylonectria norvegica]|nr:hypothetical protein G7046_g4894 [Stylonectria norvegica]
MAGANLLPPDFQVSYRDRDSYPLNYTHRSISTYRSALVESAKRLDDATANLFEVGLGMLEISFRDLKTDNGSGQDVGKLTMHSPEELTDWLGVRQQSSSDATSPHDVLTTRQKDPKCRFISIYGQNSRSRLRLTRSMLTEILTFHQVMPDYLDFLFVFGQQDEAQDARFSSFREQVSLRKECSMLAIDSLARSGRQYQFCYNLKGVTDKSPGSTSSQSHVYSIRQAAIYHRLDIVNGNTLWIVTKGNADLQKRFKELTSKNARPQDRSFGNAQECFRSSLSAHLLYCHWSTEDWRGYLKWLELVFEEKTKMALFGPTGVKYHHRVYTPDDIQFLLRHEESISEVIVALESNVEVMGSLRHFYEKLAANKHFDMQDCADDIDVFKNEVNNVMHNFKLQIGRAKALVALSRSRTELVKQHRLERLNQHMEREAILVRIVTMVTLIYLPATFVSTLSSTDIIKYQGQNSPGGNFSRLALERWIEVTLPLTIVTLVLAYLGRKLAEDKIIHKEDPSHDAAIGMGRKQAEISNLSTRLPPVAREKDSIARQGVRGGGNGLTGLKMEWERAEVGFVSAARSAGTSGPHAVECYAFQPAPNFSSCPRYDIATL